MPEDQDVAHDDHVAEYAKDGTDNDSDATPLSDVPLDQWEHENANVFNQDEYGFGFENDIDLADMRLFDQPGIQPNGFGMIPWDKSPASKDDGIIQLSEDPARE
eukprot:4946038-Amphidinium_carterae.1